MGRGATKATKKYAASGQLKQAIQTRRKHQQIKKKIQGRKGKQEHKEQSRSRTEDAKEHDDEDEDEATKTTKGWIFHWFTTLDTI